MAGTRHVQREWLDELPADDPRALRSRRDLSRINMWMLQPRIMARALRTHAAKTPRTILDLGAGDGTFMLRVASLLAPRWTDVAVIMLDQNNVVSRDTRNNFLNLRWDVQTVTADLFAALKDATLPNVDIVTANLFLHHFPETQLSQLLARAAPLAPLFVACEPRRAPLARFASRLVGLIGCNDVSRHDAVVSVEAGFDGHELSALWPGQFGWELHENAAGLFTHCFVARRARQGA